MLKQWAIVSTYDNMVSKFEDFKTAFSFRKNGFATWNTNLADIYEFGNKEFIKIANHFRDLLSKKAVT